MKDLEKERFDFFITHLTDARTTFASYRRSTIASLKSREESIALVRNAGPVERCQNILDEMQRDILVYRSRIDKVTKRLAECYLLSKSGEIAFAKSDGNGPKIADEAVEMFMAWRETRRDLSVSLAAVVKKWGELEQEISSHMKM